MSNHKSRVHYMGARPHIEYDQKMPGRLSVAVFLYDYSTSGATHSGGRYHALLLAYALAYGGSNVTVIANALPRVSKDLRVQYGKSLTTIVTPSFDPSELPSNYDFVIVAPSGGLKPEFYGCAEVVASRSNATMVLLNYESPNWFNELAPTPDYLEVWDSWSRLLVSGGHVLSTTLESDRHARPYYKSLTKPIEFHTCYAPLNTRAADEALDAGPDRKEAVVFFARPYHDHKGTEDIQHLPAELFGRRTLRLIFGGEPDNKYCDRLSAVTNRHGGSIEVYSQVSEAAKFKILAESKLLLFPSRFEGFGYPPLEAALVGTETACYDLPVLRETLGDLGNFAPFGDTAALGSLAVEIANREPRSDELKRHAADIAGFDTIAQRLTPEINRWTRIPIAEADYVILWGPWTPDDFDGLRSKSVVDTPNFPVHGDATSHGDDIKLNIKAWVDRPISSADIRTVLTTNSAHAARSEEQGNGWLCVTMEFIVPHAELQDTAVLTMRSADDRIVRTVTLKCVKAG